MAEAGHTFLAKLGKKRLRPGGKRATDWLIDKRAFGADKKVLEVACNMGTTTVALAKEFGCHITAIDLDEKVIEKARENIATNRVADLVTLQQANAMELPFADESFDIVVNEAMLTMQTPAGKDRCLREYLRVLKPGGILLTHDVLLKRADDALRSTISQAIHVSVNPLTKEEWESLAKANGFSSVEMLSGDMSLMSLDGMVYDEGWLGTFEILKNALKPENIERFQTMYRVFRENRENLGFIAMASRK